MKTLISSHLAVPGPVDSVGLSRWGQPVNPVRGLAPLGEKGGTYVHPIFKIIQIYLRVYLALGGTARCSLTHFIESCPLIPQSPHFRFVSKFSNISIIRMKDLSLNFESEICVAVAVAVAVEVCASFKRYDNIPCIFK